MERKTTIEAAGGIVRDPQGRVLMIFRRGHWDLPKGKWEPGETIEQCAVREVEEECGVTGLSIEASVGTTEHTYAGDEGEIIKRTYWFLMHCPGGALTPQTEEDIDLAEWVEHEELNKRLPATYPTIGKLLERVLGV